MLLPWYSVQRVVPLGGDRNPTHVVPGGVQWGVHEMEKSFPLLVVVQTNVPVGVLGTMCSCRVEAAAVIGGIVMIVCTNKQTNKQKGAVLLFFFPFFFAGGRTKGSRLDGRRDLSP